MSPAFSSFADLWTYANPTLMLSYAPVIFQIKPLTGSQIAQHTCRQSRHKSLQTEKADNYIYGKVHPYTYKTMGTKQKFKKITSLMQ